MTLMETQIYKTMKSKTSLDKAGAGVQYPRLTFLGAPLTHPATHVPLIPGAPRSTASN